MALLGRQPALVTDAVNEDFDPTFDPGYDVRAELQAKLRAQSRITAGADRNVMEF